MIRLHDRQLAMLVLHFCLRALHNSMHYQGPARPPEFTPGNSLKCPQNLYKDILRRVLHMICL